VDIESLMEPEEIARVADFLGRAPRLFLPAP
jgi:hypothetical protein